MKKILIVVTLLILSFNNKVLAKEVNCAEPKGFHEKLMCKMKQGKEQREANGETTGSKLLEKLKKHSLTDMFKGKKKKNTAVENVEGQSASTSDEQESTGILAGIKKINKRLKSKTLIDLFKGEGD